MAATAIELGELALEHPAVAREVGQELAADGLVGVAEPLLLVPGMVDDPLRFAAGFGQELLGLGPSALEDQLGLPVGLALDVGAELLRGDQGIVHGPLPVAEALELLHHALQPVAGLAALPPQPVELLRDPFLEVVHLGDVVAAQPSMELLVTHVVRAELEGFVRHCIRSPNSSVPSRIIVAPSSTAIGKSPDIPMERSATGNPAASTSAFRVRSRPNATR